MKKNQTWRVLSILVVALLSFLMFSPSVRAQGGPPLLTDDPATPGDGMWEINFLSTLGRSRSGWILETPNVDLNYGLGNHLQLKLEAPWVVMKEPGEKTKSGPGNSMVGVKWRFLDEERRGFDLSIYPQLEFNNPTNSVSRGMVDKGARLFLPVEIAKKVGPVEVVGEVGYRVVHHGPDEWEYGILFSRAVSTRVELIGELHGSALQTFAKDELFFNAGSRVRLGKEAVLLISAGRTIRNPGGEGPQNIAAVGIQFNFRKQLPRFARKK